MHRLLTFLILTVLTLTDLSAFAVTVPGEPALVDSPKSSTCSTVAFSYTVTGIRLASLSNRNVPNTATVVIPSGKKMIVSQLVANVALSNLRFIEAITSNGNVIFTGTRVPLNRGQ